MNKSKVLKFLGKLTVVTTLSISLLSTSSLVLAADESKLDMKKAKQELKEDLKIVEKKRQEKTDMTPEEYQKALEKLKKDAPEKYKRVVEKQKGNSMYVASYSGQVGTEGDKIKRFKI